MFMLLTEQSIPTARARQELSRAPGVTWAAALRRPLDSGLSDDRRPLFYFGLEILAKLVRRARLRLDAEGPELLAHFARADRFAKQGMDARRERLVGSPGREDAEPRDIFVAREAGLR